MVWSYELPTQLCKKSMLHQKHSRISFDFIINHSAWLVHCPVEGLNMHFSLQFLAHRMHKNKKLSNIWRNFHVDFLIILYQKVINWIKKKPFTISKLPVSVLFFYQILLKSVKLSNWALSEQDFLVAAVCEDKNQFAQAYFLIFLWI